MNTSLNMFASKVSQIDLEVNFSIENRITIPVKKRKYPPNG